MDAWKNNFVVKAQGICNELATRFISMSMILKDYVGAFENEKT